MKSIGPPVLHRFEGGGLTGYLLLSESHISFHTYPEHRFLALDIFLVQEVPISPKAAAFRVFLAASSRPGREHLTTTPGAREIPQGD